MTIAVIPRGLHGLEPAANNVISVSDPDQESGFGSRRAKMTHRNRKKITKFHVLKRWMFSFEG
jgi:hypothetical protein